MYTFERNSPKYWRKIECLSFFFKSSAQTLVTTSDSGENTNVYQVNQPHCPRWPLLVTYRSLRALYSGGEILKKNPVDSVAAMWSVPTEHLEKMGLLWGLGEFVFFFSLVLMAWVALQRDHRSHILGLSTRFSSFARLQNSAVIWEQPIPLSTSPKWWDHT